MTTGDRIKNARKAAKMTQQEVADKLGMKGPSYQQYESGRRNPKRETLRKIAAAIGVPEWELTGDDEYPSAFTPDIKKEPAPESGLSAEEDKLVGYYREMNDVGQKKLLGYADDLVSSGKYEKESSRSVG